MEFSNEFRVGLPLDPAWDLLGDVERIAPCMPGAQLTGAEGDEYQGTVKVRVGPVAVQYKGTATIEQRDRENRTLVLRAAGRDSKGQGTANAHVTALLAPDGDGTRVTVTTKLSVTGKVAQFGKGVMEDISRKLLAQFTASLEQMLAAERQQAPQAQAADTREAPVEAGPEPAAPPSQPPPTTLAVPAAPAAPEGTALDGAAQGAASGAVSTATVTAAAPAPAPAPQVEPIDLLGMAGGPVLKRLVPAVVVLLVIVGAVLWLVLR
ncbi:MAG TPA: SRPBCC family protein [Actinocrinis sp.]|jgi:hypothetical protein